MLPIKAIRKDVDKWKDETVTCCFWFTKTGVNELVGRLERTEEAFLQVMGDMPNWDESATEETVDLYLELKRLL